MSAYEEPRDLVSCLQLLVMPWRLPQTVFVVSPVIACLLGSLSVWWILGSFLTYEAVMLSELGGWTGEWQDVIDAAVPCAIGSGVIALVCGIAIGATHRMSHRGHHPLVFALSFVCVIPFYLIWLLPNILYEISYHKQIFGGLINNVTDALIGELIADSCFWLPILGFVWIIFVVRSIKAADKIAQLRYQTACTCGYDLRGSIAGGSKTCPECGAEVPAELRANPPSIHTDL